MEASKEKKINTKKNPNKTNDEVSILTSDVIHCAKTEESCETQQSHGETCTSLWGDIEISLVRYVDFCGKIRRQLTSIDLTDLLPSGLTASSRMKNFCPITCVDIKINTTLYILGL